MIEENVVAATGVRVQANRADLVHAIREAGFLPRSAAPTTRSFEGSGRPGDETKRVG